MMNYVRRIARGFAVDDETLALDGAERIGKGKLTLDVQVGTQQPGAQATEAVGATFDDLKDMLRPSGVHMGVMRADPDKCTSCGLCLQNCPFKCWEMSESGYPKLREGYICFTCSNCMVACATDAISIVAPYHVSGGFWATEPHPLPVKMPLRPRDKDGNLDEWNAVERLVLERRSVRNFKDEPVPDHLIRRVLEAGRFAPSAGNCQPWQFVVITNRALIAKMDEAVVAMSKQVWAMYNDDEVVKGMGPIAETTPYAFDPRSMWGGIGTIARGDMAPSLGAPCLILLVGDARAVTGPQIPIFRCGPVTALPA